MEMEEEESSQGIIIPEEEKNVINQPNYFLGHEVISVGKF